MSKDWKIDILENYCTLENGIKTKNEKLPYLDVKYLREQNNPQFKINGNKVFNGELLILVDGENSGELFQITEDGYMGSTFKKVVVENIDHNFVKNIIIQNKEFYKNTKTGSAIPHLNKHLFRNTRFLCPPLEEQKKIADILSSLDNKIELNNQINKDLEELAQTLYTKWFVNFDFPNEEGKPYKSNGGEMIDSELGEIPIGWSISNIFNNITEKNTKNKENKDINVLSVLSNNSFVLSDDKFKNQVYSKDLTNYKIIKKGEIGFNPSRANIGSIGMLNEFDEGLLSPMYKIFKVDDTLGSNYFSCYMNHKDFISNIKFCSFGSVRSNFNIEYFKKFKITLPSQDIIKKFDIILDKIFNQIELLEKESQQLKKTRDLLLPYLMSGKIVL